MRPGDLLKGSVPKAERFDSMCMKVGMRWSNGRKSCLGRCSGSSENRGSLV